MDDMGLENARDYYGRVLSGSADLRTNACATTDKPDVAVSQALLHVHEEVRARYYGCGLVIPPALKGARILDLGCGAGQDCFVLAQLAGPDGAVVGVDATREQLEVAHRHTEWHRARFKFQRSTVEFREGDIARLDTLDLVAGSFDVIVSNCVINLVEDKAAVFAGARRLLKPGGELYFSDIYADRRVPPALRKDPVLHGECLSGALYWRDFLDIAKASGFADPRLVSDRPLAVNDAEIAEKAAPVCFHSATFRLFNIEGLEPACEDYGQAVRYRGTISGSPTFFELDKHHHIETGRLVPVCGNTWRMLRESRFEPHFEFFGDTRRHFGAFKGCGADIPFDADAPETSAASKCC
jgi:SAM-dependent methyltransferase